MKKEVNVNSKLQLVLRLNLNKKESGSPLNSSGRPELVISYTTNITLIQKKGKLICRYIVILSSSRRNLSLHYRIQELTFKWQLIILVYQIYKRLK